MPFLLTFSQNIFIIELFFLILYMLNFGNWATALLYCLIVEYLMYWVGFDLIEDFNTRCVYTYTRSRNTSVRTHRFLIACVELYFALIAESVSVYMWRNFYSCPREVIPFSVYTNTYDHRKQYDLKEDEKNLLQSANYKSSVLTCIACKQLNWVIQNNGNSV